MANKKYLDLNGLGYTIRKINERKADLESPAFTGTPTISGEIIATENSVNKKILKALSEGDFSDILEQPTEKELLHFLGLEINK